ncbi:MAG TPA: DUF2239 family protein [Steroidobacteraceae bacterium]|nr:DUF2239 family protein [Steroidobacteraceae bacterium]
MNDQATLPICTAFCGLRRVANGPLDEVAATARAELARGGADPIRIYEDATGRLLEVDLRGNDQEIVERLRAPARGAEFARGRGRPRLGVVAREVTLRPSDWEWLNAQPGGASVALRRLVERARGTAVHAAATQNDARCSTGTSAARD